MDELLKTLPQRAKDRYNEDKKFFAKLRKKPPKKLDYIMQDLHDEEFSRTDCLECANCCKTTGPLFTAKDVTRIAKHFNCLLYTSPSPRDRTRSRMPSSA